MNLYLLIIGVLLVLLSFNLNCKSNFSSIPETISEPYKLDSRYEYPYNPPVNPNAKSAEIINQIAGSSELYGETGGNLLDGQSLIKVPLQYNDPYKEQLRSQDILITPYNRIKYSTNC